MNLRLAGAPVTYDKAAFDAWRMRLEEVVGRCHLRGQDIEVGQTRDGSGAIVSSRIIQRDRVTGARYAIVIDSGVLSLELVT